MWHLAMWATQRFPPHAGPAISHQKYSKSLFNPPDGAHPAAFRFRHGTAGRPSLKGGLLSLSWALHSAKISFRA